MTLFTERNEQAWQNLIKVTPNMNTDLNRVLFDHAFYEGILAEQKSNQSIRDAA